MQNASIENCVLGDLRGKITSIQPNGCSTNDYIIAGQNLVPEIQCFKVMPINICVSDHALIFTSIATNMKQNQAEESTEKLHKIDDGFKWTNNAKHIFEKSLEVEMEHVNSELLNNPAMSAMSEDNINKIDELIYSTFI